MSVAEPFIAKLTERKGLTPAQIRTAVRFAQLAAAEDVSTEDLIERQPQRRQRALGTRSSTRARAAA